VFLKIFTRVESKRAGWDDFFIFFSMVRIDNPRDNFLRATKPVCLGIEHHRHGFRLILGHSRSRPTRCSRRCSAWHGTIRTNSLLADHRIPFQYRYLVSN
jgi:hypothetical protein